MPFEDQKVDYKVLLFIQITSAHLLCSILNLSLLKEETVICLFLLPILLLFSALHIPFIGDLKFDLLIFIHLKIIFIDGF